jgi:hypothetical protein
MRIGLRQRVPGEIEYGLIYGTIAILGLLAVRILPVSRLAPSCPFHRMTGLPCPTCGGTRAAVLLSGGNVSAALSLNPLVTVAFLGVLLFFFHSLAVHAFGLPRVTADLTSPEKNALRAAAVLAVLAQWVYLSFSL